MGCGGCGGTSSSVSCSCKFVSTDSVEVTGTGSTEDPVVLSVDPMFVDSAASATTDAYSNGTGDPDSPRTISFEIVSSIMDEKWGRWFGSDVQYDALAPLYRTLYAVIPADDGVARGLAEARKFAVGADIAVRAYVGSVLIAETYENLMLMPDLHGLSGTEATIITAGTFSMVESETEGAPAVLIEFGVNHPDTDLEVAAGNSGSLDIAVSPADVLSVSARVGNAPTSLPSIWQLGINFIGSGEPVQWGVENQAPASGATLTFRDIVADGLVAPPGSTAARVMIKRLSNGDENSPDDFAVTINRVTVVARDTSIPAFSPMVEGYWTGAETASTSKIWMQPVN